MQETAGFRPITNEQLLKSEREAFERLRANPEHQARIRRQAERLAAQNRAVEASGATDPDERNAVLIKSGSEHDAVAERHLIRRYSEDLSVAVEVDRIRGRERKSLMVRRVGRRPASRAGRRRGTRRTARRASASREPDPEPPPLGGFLVSSRFVWGVS